MKNPGKGTLIASLTVMLVGVAALGFGGHAFVAGAAVEAQTGNSGQMGAGAALAIAGLFLLMAPPVTWLAKAFTAQITRERAWKATLTPQERFAVNAAETAAMGAAAVAGWEANKAASRRVRERYDETDAAAARYLESQAGGWAGLPTATGTTGQPGPVTDPTPGQYQQS
jgi:hypothetical protein